MAKVSQTSITVDKSKQHSKAADYRAELACKKIVGFHLQKTKTGSTWRFRYRDVGGNARIINLGKFVDGTKDRLEAAELALTYRGQVEAGADPAAEMNRQLEQRKAEHELQKSATVGAYLEGIYKRHQARKKDSGEHNLNFIRKHFSDWLTMPMADITPNHLKQWQLQKENDGLAHATIQRVFGAFRTMIRHAVTEGVLTDDPIIKFRLQRPVATQTAKKLDGSDKLKRRMLTKEELHGLMYGMELFKADCMEKMSKPDWKRDIPMWFYPFFYIAYYTGLRPGDLYTLNWHEVNLTFKTINTKPNKTQHHPDPIQINQKLNDHLIGILKEWHTQQGKPITGLVFPPDTARLTKERKAGEVATMDKKTHTKHWKRLLKLGKVDSDLEFYSLRHHFISKLVTAGLPLLTVANLAGHKSQKMIEQHYGHLSPNAANDVMNIMASDVPHFDIPKTQKMEAV